jgi:Domain of unknown function (DUF5658)
MSGKGAKMRKWIAGLIVLFILTISVSWARADASDPGSGPLLVLTALAPLNPSPLANLDLLPAPAPIGEARVTSISGMNLDPRLVARNYVPTFIGREIGLKSVGDRLFDTSLYSLAALNVADYFSTREALRNPNLREANPLLKNIVKSPVAFAAVKIGVSAASYITLKSLYKKSKALAWVVSVASNFAMSYVVSNNMRLIDRVKGK